jgi:hypothetical protein
MCLACFNKYHKHRFEYAEEPNEGYLDNIDLEGCLNCCCNEYMTRKRLLMKEHEEFKKGLADFEINNFYLP